MAEEKKNNGEEKEGKEWEKTKEKRKRVIWEFILENAQNLGIILSIALGIRKPDSKTTIEGKERQVPDWVLSAFPNLTREDDTEYNLALDSHPNINAQLAAKEFRATMVKEDIYDDVRYIVDLIKIRREFTERTKKPAPPDKSGGRLKFEPLNIKDSVNAFFSELLAEKNLGGTPEEIYTRQKERAKERNLLPKKHIAKRCVEWIGSHKAETVVGIILLPIGFIQFIIWVLS